MVISYKGSILTLGYFPWMYLGFPGVFLNSSRVVNFKKKIHGNGSYYRNILKIAFLARDVISQRSTD